MASSDRVKSSRILRAAVGRPVSTDADRQEAVVRVVFAAKTAGLAETDILRAFMAAWPFVSAAHLRVSLTWPKPEKKKGKR